MTAADDARQMDLSRGYRDINPDNCLADWNRMRTQITGRGYSPKLVLCLPGGDDYEARAKSVLQQAGVEHEFRGRDTQMANAFAYARCKARPSLSEHDLEAIARHSTVLYVLSRKFNSEQAAIVARDFLQLGRQLLEVGGLGIKCESSGIAHSASFWTELTTDAEEDADFRVNSGLDFWAAVYSAYVQLPIQSDTDFYSCGMHILGQPDMIVSTALMSTNLADEELADYEAVKLFNGFGIYVSAECGDRGFVSGHTFSLNSESRWYRVIWEPCEGYDEDDFFFNPYGRWRFVNP